MRPRPRLTTLTVAAVLAALPVAVGGTSTGAERTTADEARAQEYVVAYEGGAQAARRRVQAAGGQVVEVLEEIGVARVRSRDGEFLDDVRGRQGIAGAARNHAVGTARPGLPHRFAQERPPAADRARVPAEQIPGQPGDEGGSSDEREPSPPGRPGQGGHRGARSEPGGPGGRGARLPRERAPASIPSAGSVPPGEHVPPQERSTVPQAADPEGQASTTTGVAGAEPLAARQWDMQMIGATPDAAHQQATGAGVDVGVIDTGIDGNHPDIAPNFDRSRSRNFTIDRPDTDGPCEVATCVDPADVDDGGHGTHVAATIAAASNGFGMAGVAPAARLVNLRAGQDSGYFFVFEVAEALVTAGDQRLDVVNMSFYTDPWLYNCTARGEYVSGTVSDEELAQQRLVRHVVGEALEYAHAHGVTLIAAAGNEHADLAAPERTDTASPGFPSGRARPRTVRRSCLDLPAEGRHVIAVGSVGPSGVKADYSNYGQGSIDVVAPGGWLRDRPGSPDHRGPANLVLGAFPLQAAKDQDLAGSDGQPLDGFSLRHCDAQNACGFYTHLQGTSMAAPHAAGVAALIIQRHGEGTPEAGYRLSPTRVAQILASTATDKACPPEGSQSYVDAGHGDDWTAACEGTAAVNGLYGEGLISATAATAASAGATATSTTVPSTTATTAATSTTSTAVASGTIVNRLDRRAAPGRRVPSR